MTKVYRGTPNDGDPRVVVIEDGHQLPLNPRYDLRNHSPDGFAWGYGGSGPSQLAIAILADVIGENAALESTRLYHDFKWEVISKLPMDQPFELTEKQVIAWIDKNKAPLHLESNKP